jgi:hypothetical protein
MKDETPGTIASRYRVQTVELVVVRLPDGNVRMNGSSAIFPKTCPRCGSVQANTDVKLRFAKFRLANFLKLNSWSVKIPFCQRCGGILNAVPWVAGFVSFVFMTFVVPLLKIPGFGVPSRIPPYVAAALAAAFAAAAIEGVPRMMFKPRVEIVAVEKGSGELAFEDRMYAEQFVELNRAGVSTITSRPSVRR